MQDFQKSKNLDIANVGNNNNNRKNNKIIIQNNNEI